MAWTWHWWWGGRENTVQVINGRKRLRRTLIKSFDYPQISEWCHWLNGWFKRNRRREEDGSSRRPVLLCWPDCGHADKLWTPRRKCKMGLITGAQGTSYLQACFLTQVIIASNLPLKSCPDLQQHALLAWKPLPTHGLTWKELSFKIYCSNPLLSLVSSQRWLICIIWKVSLLF